MAKKTKQREQFQVRLSPEEREKIEGAAKIVGLSAGTWMRIVALRAADEVVKKAA